MRPGSMKFRTGLLCGCVALWVACIPLPAANFYVDFAGGNDGNDGQSTSTPWKHAPGDPNATGTAARATLRAGDTVLFKGGVKYKGLIGLGASGSAGSRITFNGNSGWGTGKAIIDGTTDLTFTPCPDRATCDNDNWSRLYYATLPTGANHTAPLFENGDWLWFAQAPAQPDPFFYTNTDGFRALSSGIDRTSCSDASFFTQADPGYWVGVYFMAHVTGNSIGVGKISAYDPAAHKVTYSDLGAIPDVAGDWDGKYHFSVFNHVRLINAAGQYAMDESVRRIYVWPRVGTSNITIGSLPYGIDLNGQQYITIDGFIFDGQYGSTYQTGRSVRSSNSTASGGTVIQNCEMRNSELGGASGSIYVYGTAADVYVQNNHVHHIRGRGMTFVGDRIHANNNRIRYVSGTTIYFAGVTNGEINGNDIDDCKGTHSNGISVYQNSANVTVANNKILNIHNYYGPFAVTHEASKDLTFYNNIVDGKFYSWGPVAGCNFLRMYNNVVTGLSYVSSPTNCAEITWKNNITAGIDKSSATVHSNNVYVGLFWNQSSGYGWTLGAGELVEFNLAKVFVDAAGHNFRLAAGSPALGAGVDLGSLLPADIDGVVRGSRWDIGAYQSGGSTLGSPKNLRVFP